MKRRAGRPTRDDTRRKSEALLEAATTLFVGRGFDGTTMEAIALAANMGKQAVYMRFPDKEKVFIAVIERLKEIDDAIPLRFDDSLPLEDGLVERIYAIMTASASPTSRLIAHLAFREGHRFPSLFELLWGSTLKRYVQPLKTFIEAAKARGEVRAIDSFAAASICTDLIFSEMMRALFRQETLSQEHMKRTSTQIANFVFNGLRSQSGSASPGSR